MCCVYKPNSVHLAFWRTRRLFIWSLNYFRDLATPRCTSQNLNANTMPISEFMRMIRIFVCPICKGMKLFVLFVCHSLISIALHRTFVRCTSTVLHQGKDFAVSFPTFQKGLRNNFLKRLYNFRNTASLLAPLGLLQTGVTRYPSNFVTAYGR